MSMKAMMLLVGIVNAGVLVVDNHVAHVVWAAVSFVLFELCFHLLVRHGKEQGNDEAYIQGANDAVDHIKARRHP